MATFCFPLSLQFARTDLVFEKKICNLGIKAMVRLFCLPFFSHRHKETTVTDSLKWKVKLTAWRMRILWNISLCTVALQIYAPKRKLSGSKEDHSFEPSVRLVHSPSAANISDTHKHSSIRLRHKWWSRDIFHQYLSAALCHVMWVRSSIQYTVATFTRTKVNVSFYQNVQFFLSCFIFLLIFSSWYTLW